MKETDNKKKSTKIIQLFFPLTFNNKWIIVIYSLYLYFFFTKHALWKTQIFYILPTK